MFESGALETLYWAVRADLAGEGASFRVVRYTSPNDNVRRPRGSLLLERGHWYPGATANWRNKSRAAHRNFLYAPAFSLVSCVRATYAQLQLDSPAKGESTQVKA